MPLLLPAPADSPAPHPVNGTLGPALRRAVALLLCGAWAGAWAPVSAQAIKTPLDSAQASPWERAGQYEGRTLYIDPTTARRSGSRIQIFVITDLKEPNATARGRTYWSKKALLELDCSLKTLKLLQDTWYPRKMAQGEPVWQTDGASMAAMPVQADSPSEILWKAACGRR